MSDEQTDQLIALGQVNADMANTAAELDRLSELTTDPGAKNLLIQLVRGYLSCATDPCEPFLCPVPMDNLPESTRHSGGGEVGNVDTLDILGSKTAIWRSTSFLHRLGFLYDGCVAVSYPAGRIPVLSMRLDLDALGIKFTVTE